MVDVVGELVQGVMGNKRDMGLDFLKTPGVGER